MPHFLRFGGDCFKLSDGVPLDLHDALPPANFIVGKLITGELYLNQVEPFKPLPKVYGSAIKHRDRIFNTFKDRSGATGVLLTGEKGSGKTLLAKELSILAASQGMPTILINSPWLGDEFNSFLQAISQPAVIIFDEFEKVYNETQQQAILTLLDGVWPTKKLFVLTCNEMTRINNHMQNRPGRIFYSLDFKGLDIEFIREYCLDNLLNKSHVEKVCQLSSLYWRFNFDMLKALVEDMNRYDETPQGTIKLLNAKPDSDNHLVYEIDLFVKGMQMPKTYPNGYDAHNGTWRGVPLFHPRFKISHMVPPMKKGVRAAPTEKDDFEEYEQLEYSFTQDDLKKIDADSGTFSYVNKEGQGVTFTRYKPAAVNYMSYLD